MSSDGDFGAIEFDGVHRRQFFLRHLATIMEGQRDEGAVLVANAENIAVFQRLAEHFIAPDLTPLVEQAVQRGVALRVWVDQDELVALAHNLHVLAGDSSLADHYIRCGIATDIDDGLVKRQRFPVV